MSNLLHGLNEWVNAGTKVLTGVDPHYPTKDAPKPEPPKDDDDWGWD